MDGKTARGASSPAKPAFTSPEPLSHTRAVVSSSSHILAQLQRGLQEESGATHARYLWCWLSPRPGGGDRAEGAEERYRSPPHPPPPGQKKKGGRKEWGLRFGLELGRKRERSHQGSLDRGGSPSAPGTRSESHLPRSSPALYVFALSQTGKPLRPHPHPHPGPRLCPSWKEERPRSGTPDTLWGTVGLRFRAPLM